MIAEPCEKQPVVCDDNEPLLGECLRSRLEREPDLACRANPQRENTWDRFCSSS